MSVTETALIRASGGASARSRRPNSATRAPFALHLEEDRARIVADESGQTQLAGDSVDERTEANPLDNTGHGEALPNFVGPQQQGGVGHLNRPLG